MPQDHPGMMMPNTGVQQPRIIGSLNPLTVEAGPNPNILAIGNPGLIKKAAGQSPTQITSPNKYQLLASEEDEEDIPVFASIDQYYESINRTLKEEKKAAKKERKQDRIRRMMQVKFDEMTKEIDEIFRGEGEDDTCVISNDPSPNNIKLDHHYSIKPTSFFQNQSATSTKATKQSELSLIHI